MTQKEDWERAADECEKAAHLDNHKAIVSAILAAILGVITISLALNLFF